jgi:hypothetical protein
MWSSTFLDESGRPSFNILQNHRTTSLPVYYYAFDLLAYRGKSLRNFRWRHGARYSNGPRWLPWAIRYGCHRRSMRAPAK